MPQKGRDLFAQRQRWVAVVRANQSCKDGTHGIYVLHYPRPLRLQVRKAASIQFQRLSVNVLYAYLFGTARNLGIEILAMGGTANHIHILVALPAKCPLSYAVRDPKANSSRWMAENGSHFSWQEGFGAFSVSPSQAAVVKVFG